MASSWGGEASEQADLIATRLRQLVSSGLHFLRDELGVDLGLKPERYPSWAILCTALIGPLLLLVFFAACGGARRRKQGAARSQNSAAVTASETAKVAPVKAPKPDEPKKKNKKKAAEKKNQSNGGTAPEAREQVKGVKELQAPAKQTPAAPAARPAPAPAARPAPAPAARPAPAPAPAARPAPAPAARPAPAPAARPAPAPAPRPAPAQQEAIVDTKAEKTKKSKKKPKPEVKATQAVSSADGKEPDEGAWETKISNREKRQQRKKEKGSNDESGSPGGGQHVGQHTEQPAVTAPVKTKKNKESLNVKAAKGDANVTPVLSTWNNVSSVNSGGWTDMSVKIPPQVSASDREKSSVSIKTSGHRTSEPLAWAQESEGSWTSMEGRIKPEVNRMNFSMLRLNRSVGVPATAAGVGNGLPIADEWSGFNGLGAADPSSDWNAPTELWGNYDEPKPATPAPKEKSVSEAPRLQESDDDKDKGDPSVSGKSKRKKKKKKKPEDENSGSQVTTESSGAPAESGLVKPCPPVPMQEPTKQVITPQPGQKKSDQNLDPLKQVHKKKARRET